MGTRLVEVVAVLIAPIPVGHRVEVRAVTRRVHGLFGGQTLAPEHQPMITDLDTGVVYASELPWTAGEVKRPDAPLPVGALGAPSAELTLRVAGRVRACRVLTLRTLSEVDVQTHLQIEVDG